MLPILYDPFGEQLPSLCKTKLELEICPVVWFWNMACPKKKKKTNTNKLQTSINKCLRNVLQIRWPEMIPNEELWERTGQEQIITEIKRRKWGYIGHTVRKSSTKTTRQVLSWNPQGKRKVGRPRQTWRRSVEEELKAIGIRWNELGRTGQNRVRWRSIVTALCSPRNQEA